VTPGNHNIPIALHTPNTRRQGREELTGAREQNRKLVGGRGPTVLSNRDKGRKEAARITLSSGKGSKPTRVNSKIWFIQQARRKDRPRKNLGLRWGKG